MRIAFRLSCQAAAVALAVAGAPCLSAYAQDDVMSDTNKTVVGPADTAAGPSASDKEVLSNIKNDDLWPAMGRNLGLQRHSDLKAISTKNIGQMQMVWSQSTGALRGHEGQPVVVNVDGKPMMFFVSAWPNIVQALDLTDPDNPKQVWSYNKGTDRDLSAVPRACCDVVKRGVNYAKGKILFNTLDGYLDLARRQDRQGRLGRQARLSRAWRDGDERAADRRRQGDRRLRRRRVRGPRPARGLQPRRRQAHLALPVERHRFKDVCLTPDTNKAHPEHGTAGHDIGLTSYPGDEWKRGGGSPWAWYSYDPELKIVYASTGNPGNWSPTTRCKYDTHEKCNDGDAGQQVVDDDLRPQGRHRRGGLGLPDDPVRPVGL